ncbi:hypothetical protein Phum_PHUM426130 [Pediculus humanus corporis]|uniref:Uncharacterized protein n=1 Tax=Pediculus humanus subsp. corporis TaxID=121224 RepID=E0VT32_PEDHC|nr:uncharacterized protein Phum_PHUM426130 [Pediculus humanus corporis]EEB16538.1 hypothetical protein Phum_PHUM426130 [Pediculus humanus corporis]
MFNLFGSKGQGRNILCFNIKKKSIRAGLVMTARKKKTNGRIIHSNETSFDCFLFIYRVFVVVLNPSKSYFKPNSSSYSYLFFITFLPFINSIDLFMRIGGDFLNKI